MLRLKECSQPRLDSFTQIPWLKCASVCPTAFSGCGDFEFITLCIKANRLWIIFDLDQIFWGLRCCHSRYWWWGIVHGA